MKVKDLYHIIRLYKDLEHQIYRNESIILKRYDLTEGAREQIFKELKQDVERLEMLKEIDINDPDCLDLLIVEREIEERFKKEFGKIIDD